MSPSWDLRAGAGECSVGRSSGSRLRLTGGLLPVLRSFSMRLFRNRLLALASVAGAACAETSAPLPPPEEVVVVLNTTAATLSLVPVASPGQVSTVPLGASDAD